VAVIGWASTNFNQMENRNFYLKKLQESIGDDTPTLSQVLKWHSSDGRDKYSHFEVSKDEAYFSVYDGEESDSIVWNLTFEELENQSDEIIEWLAELI